MGSRVSAPAPPPAPAPATPPASAPAPAPAPGPVPQLHDAAGSIRITVAPGGETVNEVEALDAGADDDGHAAVTVTTPAAVHDTHGVGEGKLQSSISNAPDIHTIRCGGSTAGSSNVYHNDAKGTCGAAKDPASLPCLRHGAGTSDIVSQLQSRAFFAKLVVTLLTNGFDGCARLVFVLSVLKAVQLHVLRPIAVVGVMLGVFSLERLVLIPPTIAACAALAASRLNESDEEGAAVIGHCRGNSRLKVLLSHIAVAYDPSIQLRGATVRHGAHDSMCTQCCRTYMGFYECECITTSSTAVRRGAVMLLAFVVWQGLLLATLAWGDPLWLVFMWPYIITYLSLPLVVPLVMLCCLWKLKLAWSSVPKLHQLSLCTVRCLNAGSLFLGFGVGTLPGVWSWQCLTYMRPLLKSAAVDAQQKQDKRYQLELVRVLNESIRPATTRLLLTAWPMFVVYSLTEWIRILSLAAATYVAVRWHNSPEGKREDPPLDVQAFVAVFSLAVEYIKSVREKWQLLERGMQQMSYGGALVLLLDDWLHNHHDCHDGWLSDDAVPVLRQPLHLQDFVKVWHNLQQPLDEIVGRVLSDEGLSPDEGAEFVSMLLQAQELLRAANTAVMADNFKASYV